VSPSPAQEPQVSAANLPRSTTVFASPVNGGCYIAAPGQCKIHVEPFTIDIASGSKLATFQLVTIQIGPGTQKVIYNWKPDQSNPPPVTGTTYTPSLVALDFAATCGNTYQLSLQGRDSLDSSLFNLGLTGSFTCPTTAP
jgi:hypothetical protein